MATGRENSRLVLGNRPGSLKLLQNFVRRWGQSRGLPAGRQEALEQAAVGIFRHLMEEAYGPDQPGAITVSLEDRGPRVRLVFEDDAPPFNHPGSNGIPPTFPATVPAGVAQRLPQADSLIYYRTDDQKNRFVLTLTL